MADKGLFSRLQRLFSSDVIIRNVGNNRLRTFDTQHIQVSGDIQTNSLIDRYNKIYTNNITSLYGRQVSYNYRTLRPTLYAEYDAMDTDAIVASALDIISDESTLKNDLGEVLHIKSPDEDIQKILYNLFYDVLNIEFNLWPWIRNMCKYGDFFLKLEIAEGFGVYNVIPYSAFNIERLDYTDPENPSKVIFKFDPDGIVANDYGYYNVPDQPQYKKDGSIYFENYEMAHFRLLTDVNFLPYGRSYIEPARKLFKQYTLMEDAMLVHRIVRAPEKRIFYLNIGSIPPNEVEAFMGYDENLEGKATLAAQDIRFARTIERIQRIITSELYKIAMVHLYSQGYTGEQLANFEISLTNPSIIYDQERIALLTEKTNLAKELIESGLLPTDWVYENVFHLSEDQYDEYRDLILQDKKRKFRQNQLENEGNDPMESGKSYGTPHDLASLYGKGRTYSDPNNLPDGYNENEPLGRPQEKVTNRNTQDDNFGKDRLGVQRMKDTDKNEGNSINPQFKGGSALSLEGKSHYNKYSEMFKDIPSSNGKRMIFEDDKSGESLLDESNIRD